MRTGLIIPCRNAVLTLERLLISVQKIRPKLHVVVVDNNSTDGSQQLLENFRRKSFVDIVLFEERIGVSFARNAGLQWYRSFGPPGISDITFADSDDVFVATELPRLGVRSELLVMSTQECCLRGSLDVCTADLTRKDIYVDREVILHYEDFTEYLMRPNSRSEFTSVWGKIYRFDIIKKSSINFDERMSTYEDLDFNFRYLSLIKSVSFSSSIVYSHISDLNRRGQTFQNLNYLRMFGYVWALRSLRRLLIRLNHPEPEIVYHTLFCYFSITMVRIGFMVRSRDDLRRFKDLVSRSLRSKVHCLARARYNAEKGGTKFMFRLFATKCTWLFVVGAIIKGRLRYGR